MIPILDLVLLASEELQLEVWVGIPSLLFGLQVLISLLLIILLTLSCILEGVSQVVESVRAAEIRRVQFSRMVMEISPLLVGAVERLLNAPR